MTNICMCIYLYMTNTCIYKYMQYVQCYYIMLVATEIFDIAGKG